MKNLTRLILKHIDFVHDERLDPDSSDPDSSDSFLTLIPSDPDSFDPDSL